MSPSPLFALVAAVALLTTGCTESQIRGTVDRVDPPVTFEPSSPPPPTHSVMPPESGSPTGASSPRIAAERANVVRVVDGDTVEVRLSGGATDRVRFIGVNTPESTTRHEPYGAEASRYTKSRLDGREVHLEYDAERRDRYGRLLAYVWMRPPRDGSVADVRDGMFNARLLLDGYAQTATYPPNVRYVDVFRDLQAEARRDAKGLWGLRPEPAATATATKTASTGSCDPSYPDVCIPPPPPDLDCGEIEHRRFRVVPPDPHGFDRDRDGIGCES